MHRGKSGVALEPSQLAQQSPDARTPSCITRMRSASCAAPARQECAVGSQHRCHGPASAGHHASQAHLPRRRTPLPHPLLVWRHHLRPAHWMRCTLATGNLTPGPGWSYTPTRQVAAADGLARAPCRSSRTNGNAAWQPQSVGRSALLHPRQREGRVQTGLPPSLLLFSPPLRACTPPCSPKQPALRPAAPAFTPNPTLVPESPRPPMPTQ